MESVSSLCALQVAFSGKEFTWCIICFVVCPTNLHNNNNATIKWATAAVEKHFSLDFSRSSVLTWSKSFILEGHSDGSWHTHSGLLSASSLHVFPRLQGKLSHGSGRKEPHCNDLWPILYMYFKTSAVKNHFQNWFGFILLSDNWKPMSYNHFTPSSTFLYHLSLYSDLIQLSLYYSLHKPAELCFISGCEAEWHFMRKL